MNIILNGLKSDVNCKIFLVFENDNRSNLNDKLKENLELLKRKELFKGNNGELFSLANEINNDLVPIVFVGLGRQEFVSTEKIKVAAYKAVKKAKEFKVKNIDLSFSSSTNFGLSGFFNATIEGILLSEYKFTKYKSKETNDSGVEEVNITNIPQESVDSLSEILKETEIIISNTVIARDLINEPANVLTPAALAEKAVLLAKENDIDIEVFDEDSIKELGLNAFLAVGKGSANSPRLIVLRYFGDSENKEDVLGLVGKGITFDAGGYCLKAGESMAAMKTDMAGAAAVLGAIGAIARMKLKVNVVAVIAACENLISGNAYKPGDIIKSMSGKTIEVLNTDAEGRLTLADAITYIIDKEKAAKVVDIATLTGAMAQAFGPVTTAVITNNSDFYADLERASKTSGERFWQMPSFEDYKKYIKSNIADLKNVGEKFAGGIAAGLFIGEFAQEKPWLHLDIAGTALNRTAPSSYTPTGVGVSTLYYLAKNLAK